MVHQFDILLKEVFEIAYCCSDLGKECGNALTHDMWANTWDCNTWDCSGQDLLFAYFCAWSRRADDICVHERWPQQLQSPAAGLHPTPTSSDWNTPGHEAEVPPALGLAVVIDAVFLLEFLLGSSSVWVWKILLILYCQKEKEQQQRRVHGCLTEVQNGLEFCGLGHWLLPPHKKKVKHSLFIFWKKPNQKPWKNNISNHRMKEQPMHSIRAELLDHDISKCPGEQKTCEMKM